ncbi:MAG: hypothetical protein AB7N71_05155 [Phycisphaerae bacterium]
MRWVSLNWTVVIGVICGCAWRGLAHDSDEPHVDASTGSTALGNQAPFPPTLVAPAPGAMPAADDVSLTVEVVDPENDAMRVTFFGRQAPASKAQPFTLAALPDTQFYSQSFPQIFNAQTQWIINNAAALNVRYVAHLGDIVQTPQSLAQWQAADVAITILDQDPALPYGLSVGNHDQDPCCGGAPDGTTNFNLFFPFTRYEGLVDWYGGHYGSDNDNSYYFFSASGLDFLVIHLEFDPTPSAAVLAWAENLLQTHPNHRGIVVTHYLTGTGNPSTFSAQGLATYNALRDNPNFFLMLGGHISGEGRRTDSFGGSMVHSLLADYQGRTNGGDGWLRLLEFHPADNRISIRTYSPTLNQFETDPDSEFSLTYDMGGESFSPIGQRFNVSSGAQATVPWNNLQPGTTYEWYATASDGSFVTSDIFTFTTASDAAGDMNCDGALTVGDIAGFVLALTDPVAYADAFPACPIIHADVNGDSAVSVGDIGVFVGLLTGGA